MKLVTKAFIGAFIVVIVGGLALSIWQFRKVTLVQPSRELTKAEQEAQAYADMDVFVDHVVLEDEEPYFPLANYSDDVTSKIFYKNSWYASGKHDVLRFDEAGLLVGVTDLRLKEEFPPYALVNIGPYLLMAISDRGVYQVDLETNRLVAIYNQASGLENAQNMVLGANATSVWIGTFKGQGAIDPWKRTIYFQKQDEPTPNLLPIPEKLVPPGYTEGRRGVLVSDRPAPTFQARQMYYPIFRVEDRYYLVHTNGIDLFVSGDRFPKSIYEGPVTSYWIDWNSEMEEKYVTEDGRYLIWVTNDSSEYDGQFLSASVDVFDTQMKRHVIMRYEPRAQDNVYEDVLSIEPVFKQEGAIVYVGSTSTKTGIYRIDLDRMTITK